MLRDGLTMESLIMDGNETFASMEGGSLAQAASMASNVDITALANVEIASARGEPVREAEGAQVG